MVNWRHPLLIASLVIGLSYPVEQLLQLAPVLSIAWKMAAVGCAALYFAFASEAELRWWLATILALWCLGDGLLEWSFVAGGSAFACGHVVASIFFVRHARTERTGPQVAAAAAILVLTPLIAWQLAGGLVAIYALVLAVMASTCWLSRFSRYVSGIGALMFVASDLLIFARTGQQLALPGQGLVIWYLYYLGVMLIATGVVRESGAMPAAPRAPTPDASRPR